MTFQLTSFIVGLLLLYNGANWLLTGAASLAKNIGVSPMIIGLTIVAFGTSAPELIVSIISLYEGKSMLAIGNVVGSNICNLTMVLGITALIQPVNADRMVLRRDIPIMFFASLCLLTFSLDSVISTLNGLMLLLGSIIYICLNYIVSKKTASIPKSVVKNLISRQQQKKKKSPNTIQLLIILIGTTMLVLGAKLLINASINIMTVLGISEKCIGLTIVAIGTSIPELATSIVSIIKNQIEISIGNLVGSNIFNILSVVGITATIQPITITNGLIKSDLITDYAAMLFVSLLPLLLLRKSKIITKSKGAILLGLYILYLITLFFRT